MEEAENYYKEEFANDYKLVEDIKDSKLYSFKSMMQFAALYHNSRIEE